MYDSKSAAMGIKNKMTYNQIDRLLPLAMQCAVSCGTLGHVPHQLQKLSTPKVGAIVNHDRVLKVHQGLEFSSADSYLYPQKSRAVRSGEHASLSYYNEVSYVRSPNLTFFFCNTLCRKKCTGYTNSMC